MQLCSTMTNFKLAQGPIKSLCANYLYNSCYKEIQCVLPKQSTPIIKSLLVNTLLSSQRYSEVNNGHYYYVTRDCSVCLCVDGFLTRDLTHLNWLRVTRVSSETLRNLHKLIQTCTDLHKLTQTQRTIQLNLDR